MLPDPGDLITGLGLGLLLLLLPPKRGPRRIAARLAETRRGERRYVFGPPTRQGQLADDFIERWLQLLCREWPRLVELGLPVYVLACLAEQRGADRRRARTATWASSPAGLLLDHLTGGMSEAELPARLEAAGYPPPAAKLAITPPREYLLPPMTWLRDWHRQRQEQAPPPTKPAPAAPPRLEIRTLGEIRLLAGGEDLAPALSRKPVLGFIWFYLLAVHARRPGDRLARSDLGDELYPTYRPTDQRTKVRQRISDLMADLPAQLRECVRAEEDHLSLDLAGCAFDVRRVLDLADQIRHEEGELQSEALLDQAHDALACVAAEFLPSWEEIERKGTEGRGVAGSVVADVRRQIANAHVTILLAVADCYLAQRQAQRALAYLEDGLRLRSDRPEIAQRLATAYEQVGQPGRASRLREEYGLHLT